jgi:hypothetical protein
MDIVYQVSQYMDLQHMDIVYQVSEYQDPCTWTLSTRLAST